MSRINRTARFFMLTILVGQMTCTTSAFANDEVNESLDKPIKNSDSPGEEFAGLRFGVGLSLTIDTGEQGRVENAEIIDGRVRVTKENDSLARIMLESHYFFTPGRKLWEVDEGDWGIGPFVAVQPGTGEIIEAIGIGIMIGFKRKNQGDSNSWNFGIGAVVDPNVRILGDGFKENRPPPGEETQVRFQETSQNGLLFISSFSF